MKTIEEETYAELIEGSHLLVKDRHGPKVLVLQDGRYMKLFRRKRRFSSAAFSPYAERFENAAKILADRGVMSVKVDEVFRVASIKRDAVIYQPLKGDTLRSVLAAGGGKVVLQSLARFLSDMHRKGIYFRAGHFANIIMLEGSVYFGLIDVSECRFTKGPMPLGLRARGFRPFVRYPEDQKSLQKLSIAWFIEEYLKESGVPRKPFLRKLSRVHALYNKTVHAMNSPGNEYTTH